MWYSVTFQQITYIILLLLKVCNNVKPNFTNSSHVWLTKYKNNFLYLQILTHEILCSYNFAVPSIHLLSLQNHHGDYPICCISIFAHHYLSQSKVSYLLSRTESLPRLKLRSNLIASRSFVDWFILAAIAREMSQLPFRAK